MEEVSNLPDGGTATTSGFRPDRPAPANLPSDSLAWAVAFVLNQHGYAELDEAQRLELRMHLSHLLHGAPGTPCPGSVA
jgi:hypothetical protein